MSQGCYIVFEGVVGSGKTTQSKRLQEALRSHFPDREIIWTREPGGDEIAEAIRSLAQGTHFTTPMDPVCEAYLFAAARAQSLRSVVKPAIDRGAIVIADRSFLSSVAFQGFGRGLGVDLILKINEIALQVCMPDFVLFLEVSPEIAHQRTSDKLGDKFESLDVAFFERVAEGYRFMSTHPLVVKAWRTVDTNVSLDEAYARIEGIVKPCL